MQLFNSIDRTRHMAIYVRISTASQKTDRQQEELTSYAELNQLNFNRNLDVFIDVVSGFKDGEARPNFSALKTKIALGEYRQVLFSEFSRLDRKPSNLLKDLELFTSRGIDGKISAIKNRKTTQGGPCAYGYRISEDSKIVVDETEAAVIRRIYDMFLHGMRVRTIKDTFNSENVPCQFKSGHKSVNIKRKNKGLEPIVYKRGNLENMIWRETTIRRILRYPIYIGVQKHKFHEPDPANPIPAYKRTDRKILEEFEISTPETRIISDEEFYQVSRTFAGRRANRNQGIKRQTLLKDLLRCGECGSRMCSVTKARGTAYQCAARSGRVNIKCILGPCVLMSKLDGLVLHLCIKKFAQYDLVKKSESKIKELDTAIAERSRVYDGYVTNQKEDTELYSRQVKRAIKYSINDDDADSLVQETKEEYEKKIAEYSVTLNRLRYEMSDLSRRKRSLLEIKDEKKVLHKMDEIMADQSRVKEYIHDYVTQIVLFKPDDSWVLVIVLFLDGSERWGTIKSERYKKSELSNDDLFSKYNYVCWMVNNDSHRFVYDRDSRQFTEIKYGRTVGQYTFEEFD